MSVLPVLAAREVIRRLTRAGFLHVKTQGSHYIFLNPKTDRVTSVPLHGGKDIGRGLLGKILKQADISVEEFLNL